MGTAELQWHKVTRPSRARAVHPWLWQGRVDVRTLGRWMVRSTMIVDRCQPCTSTEQIRPTFAPHLDIHSSGKQRRLQPCRVRAPGALLGPASPAWRCRHHSWNALCGVLRLLPRLALSPQSAASEPGGRGHLLACYTRATASHVVCELSTAQGATIVDRRGVAHPSMPTLSAAIVLRTPNLPSIQYRAGFSASGHPPLQDKNPMSARPSSGGCRRSNIKQSHQVVKPASRTAAIAEKNHFL